MNNLPLNAENFTVLKLEVDNNNSIKFQPKSGINNEFYLTWIRRISGEKNKTK